MKRVKKVGENTPLINRRKNWIRVRGGAYVWNTKDPSQKQNPLTKIRLTCSLARDDFLIKKKKKKEREKKRKKRNIQR